VKQRDADFEHNPWILLGAFGVIAVVLFVVLKLAASSDDNTAAHDATPTAATTSTVPDESAAAPLSPQGIPTPTGALKPGQLEKRLRQKLDAGPSLLTTDGPLGRLSYPVGRAVGGDLTTAVANIPNRTGDAGWVSSMHMLEANHPDFITLNEVGRHSTAGIDAVAPGYTAYRDPTPDHSRGAASQVMNNVVLYRSSEWRKLDGGRLRVVNDDSGFLHGHAFVWDRFITWTLLQRPSDGAIVSVASLHMPTNPAKYPTQHGRVGESRVARYSQGMDVVLDVVRQLEQYGPVLMGGDMNSHPGQGPWTAAAKMASAGFSYAKDTGVIYLFFPRSATVVGHHDVPVVSDHPALVASLAMNGSGPAR